MECWTSSRGCLLRDQVFQVYPSLNEGRRRRSFAVLRSFIPLFRFYPTFSTIYLTHLALCVPIISGSLANAEREHDQEISKLRNRFKRENSEFSSEGLMVISWRITRATAPLPFPIRESESLLASLSNFSTISVLSLLFIAPDRLSASLTHLHRLINDTQAQRRLERPSTVV